MSRTIALCLAILSFVAGADAFLPTSPALGGRFSASRKSALSSRAKGGLLGAKLTATSNVVQNQEIVAARLSDMLKLNDNKARIGDKKTVIITGASSGIGLQAAIELANVVRQTLPYARVPHHATRSAHKFFTDLDNFHRGFLDVELPRLKLFHLEQTCELLPGTRMRRCLFRT